ncbi:unnamed protein product [Paramecium octaurelia]|uniref:Uncharacterized protein n=1 Tax=Paramecium octaurelia TaxID=43137 RepID=A0A8S1WYV5_PAROT|nr:unnamed protein product [Paramecium octaurelia]
MKQITINFSELTDDAKKKYITFLAESDISVEKQSIKKPTMPQQHRARQYSANSDIASFKSYTPTKSKTYIQSHVKTEHSISTKFDDLIDAYPTIMNQISNQDLLSRPLKLNLNDLCLIVEEIYQRKFIDDTNQLTKYQTVCDISFADYVYNFLIQKFKHSKNQQIINFLASVDLHSLRKKDVSLFQSFLRYQRQEVLTFYLYTRAVIQKELKLSFYHPLRKQCIDNEQLQLNQKQVQQISQLLYNSEDRYQEFKKYFKGNYISVSDFFSAALHIYEIQHQTHKQKPFQSQIKYIPPLQFTNTTNNFDEYQVDSPLFAQSEVATDQNQQQEKYFTSTGPSQQNSNQKEQEQELEVYFKFKKNNENFNLVQQSINEKLEVKLTRFIQDLLEEMGELDFEQKTQKLEELQNSIDGIMNTLLDAIYKYDKLLWFKRLNKQPDDIGLEYIENLQKVYRSLSKTKQPQNEDLDKFCCSLMQTPELAKQIESELPWLGQ